MKRRMISAGESPKSSFGERPFLPQHGQLGHTMPFSVTWHTLLEEAEELPEGTSLITPVSHKRFRITDTQEHRVVIELEESGASRPLQRDQFETLYRRIQDSAGGFELERLPPDAEPYAAVLTLHPRFEVDETAGQIHQTDAATGTQVVDHGELDEEGERTEPDVSVYSDALLLIDALERNEIGTLEEVETHALVNLYTLLSDVQRSANDLRQDVADVLLTRMHHDRPVHSQYGSVQRTARRSRSLKDDDDVLAVLADAGIERERVLGVDPDKVDDAWRSPNSPSLRYTRSRSASTSGRRRSTRRPRNRASRA